MDEATSCGSAAGVDLEARLARRLGEVLPAFMKLLRQRVSQVGLPDGLTLPQLLILRAVASGDMHPGELARHFMMSAASVTSAVDGLVQKGYIDRRHDDRDRRTVRLRLTPAGHETVRRAGELIEPAVREMLRTLSPDRQERLLSALEDLDTLIRLVREGDPRYGCTPGAARA
ncbi:MAG TPA: MarR family transcriptional regulator [Dehalococcoidia bacterium]|nr:MarR family transcriptional regulator [Dehalococcoidia bacterium]